MAQQFNPQNVKIRTSVLVFLKGSTAPLVLYVENPAELYAELLGYMKSQSPIVVEKVAFISNQIASVAMQEEQYIHA